MIATDDISVDRLERALDWLCTLMASEPDGGADLIPIFHRLEQEIAVRRSADSAIAAARERARRVSGRA